MQRIEPLENAGTNRRRSPLSHLSYASISDGGEPR
jgi:hypothetical protein